MESRVAKILSAATLVTLAGAFFADPALAQDTTSVSAASVSHQRLGAALGIAVAVAGAATAQGRCVGAMLEAFGRNPAVGGKLLTPLLLGLALIESLVILAFVICFRLA